ncbi:hypothetical protein [Frankia nepalensis]|nr:hypothetical protein [Frankia nepalensis]
MSDVTGSPSLSETERAPASVYVHTTVPDGTADLRIDDVTAAVEGVAAELGDSPGTDVSGTGPWRIPDDGHPGAALATAGSHTLVPSDSLAGPPVPGEPDSALEPGAADGWDRRQRLSGMVRHDLIAELADRLEQLDQLLGRLEEAERQAADASEHLLLTRRWQEETVRTIQDERARMRQRQHALDELAERARAAVEAMQATYRTLPREVVELAIELQVLDRAGFVTRRAPRPRP